MSASRGRGRICDRKSVPSAAEHLAAGVRAVRLVLVDRGDVVYEKSLVCLANSRKHSRWCIAGREFRGGRFGRWVRPVGVRQDHGLTDVERSYDNGQIPQLLDIVRICFVRAAPKQYQTENERFDTRCRWTHAGVVPWAMLAQAAEDEAGPLWVNGESTVLGLNDRMAEAVAGGLRSSLRLIRPEDLRLVVSSKRANGGEIKRHVRAAFEFGGEPYRLRVTDPVVEAYCFARPDGEHRVERAFLCISLSEPFAGFVYKLAAAVITPQRRRAGT